MENIESTCKRLDHKHLKFATPWFKSYDCGQHAGNVCREFEPATRCKYLHEHWRGWDDYWGGDEPKGTVALIVDGDRSVRYKVRAKDFIDGTLFNPDGCLKWIEKTYYKQRKQSVEHPTGYELIHEKPGE